MNKFKTFIMLLFVLLNIGYGGRNLTHFEMGSPIYRDLCPGLVPLVGGQHWHAGVYEYFNISPNGNAIIRHSEMNAGAVHLTYISGEIDNYYDNYNFSGDWNSIGDEMIQFKTNFLGSFNECGVSDAAYRGSYYNHTPPYSGWDYYQVLSNISDLNNADPEYTFLDMIKPKALSYDYIFPNGGEDGQPISFMRNTTDGSPAIVVYQAIRGDGTYETNLNPFNKKVKVWLGNAENIGNTRCDGVIEFCLEKAGISVSGGEDITIGQISTLEAHNDFHTSTYNVGELCPKIQSGEQANDTELGRLTNQAPTSGGFVITPSSDGSLADISFLVNDVQSTRVYVSVYAKKAHHTEWRIIEDGQGLLKFQSIDFVSGENSAQVNIPEWNGMAEDGYHFVSLQQNMQYGVIVFDQGANYTKNIYVGGTEKELANRNIDDAGQHIVGGQLSVHDITDPSISYLNIGSGDVVDVFPDHAFNAETMIQDANTYDLSTGNFLGVFSHLNWNRHSSEFRLSKHYPDLSEEFWAFFKIKDPINFQSSGGDHVEIMIQDPWYVRNDGNKTQTGTDWVSVNDEEIGSKYFLDQNENFYENLPTYSLRAPRYSADVNGIYEFSGWTVSNQTEGPDAGEPAAAFGDATTRTTTVVFKEASAEITANYNTANPVNLAGAEMYIGSNDQLVIPAGAQIPFASGVRINCLGSISIQGTEEAPINLYGYEGQRWEGIELPIEGTIFYCDISNTNTALTLTNDAHDACLIEFTYLNIDDAFIGIDNRYNWVNDGVIEQVNVINSSFTNIHQSAILDDVGNLNEWMISGCSFVGNETYPDAKGFYVEHTNDWTEYSHIFNKIEIRDNDFSSYASAIHIDGLVYWDWLSEYPEINKIEISTNTISNCQNAGIWISGEYNLFSHHNVVQNCGKGFYLNCQRAVKVGH